MEPPQEKEESAAPQAYCLFCRTGSEHLAIRSIQQNFPELIALAPLKSLPEKRQGEWTIRDRIMLPGYIFVYASGELPFDLRRKSNHVYKILQYERGIRTLAGGDAEYALWIYRHQGLIKPSSILQVGDAIHVIDGPLLDFNGRIVKLDRHKRRVWVEVDFDGQTKTISIGAEYLTRPDQKDSNE